MKNEQETRATAENNMIILPVALLIYIGNGARGRGDAGRGTRMLVGARGCRVATWATHAHHRVASEVARGLQKHVTTRPICSRNIDQHVGLTSWMCNGVFVGDLSRYAVLSDQLDRHIPYTCTKSCGMWRYRPLTPTTDTLPYSGTCCLGYYGRCCTLDPICTLDMQYASVIDIVLPGRCSPLFVHTSHCSPRFRRR